VKRTNILLLIIISLFFTACENKKSSSQDIAVENTTEILPKKDRKQDTLKTKELSNNATVTMHKRMTTSSTGTFILTNSKQKQYTVNVDNKHITFADINTPVILINLFATWCPPCRGEIPYLSDLQKKYKNKLFVAGVLVNDTQDNHALEEFTKKYHANYYISNGKQNDAFAAAVTKALQLPKNFSLPLTILYKAGNYYIHYEGAVPVEMVEHDIQEAIR